MDFLLTKVYISLEIWKSGQEKFYWEPGPIAIFATLRFSFSYLYLYRILIWNNYSDPQIRNLVSKKFVCKFYQKSNTFNPRKSKINSDRGQSEIPNGSNFRALQLLSTRSLSWWTKGVEVHWAEVEQKWHE